jgi:F-type H+-transporting ATPase subunit delta
MSSLTTLARPYAKAAFSLAQEGQASSDSLSDWQNMLNLASEVTSNKQVAEALESPAVSPQQAVGLVTGIGGERFSEPFNSFLSVVGENRRLSLLPEVTALFLRLKQAAEKSLQVKVVAAVALDDDQLGRMSEALAKRFNCTIELDTEIDPEVLGGAIIYAGDQVIDGSLSGRLNKLTNALSQ